MSEPQPLISAVIPSHNHAAYVVGALRSVLAQDVEASFEVVIVETSDPAEPSLGLLKPFAGDPRVRLLERPDKGISGNFNQCLQAARGELVGFCCADDRWHPGHLSAALANLERCPEAILSFGRARIVDEQDQVRDDVKIFGDLKDPNPLPQLLAQGNSFCLPATVFRRDLAVKAGGFDEQVAVLQDYDLWLKLLQLGSAAHGAEPTIDFRWDGQNASGKGSTVRRRSDLIRILRRALATFPILQTDDALRASVVKALARSHRRLARRLEDREERKHHLREARKLGGTSTLRHWLEMLKASYGP